MLTSVRAWSARRKQAEEGRTVRDEEFGVAEVGSFTRVG